jgi:DNA-binding NarL/FixJ family response regulator
VSPFQKRSQLTTSRIRVLVVDDFEPFRAFVCSALQQKPELEVIAELSDGLAAVQKAEELNPDLILLDIGLPTLNGIDAARQIRKLVPKPKIIFLSQESSDDVVQEALSSGALGYVVKALAGSELLPAVEAVLRGRRFVSRGVTGQEVRPSCAPVESQKTEIARRHEVIFYRDDASFLKIFSRFIAAALESGNAVLFVATESHLGSLRRTLEARGVDVATGVQKGTYVPVNVEEMLSAFMVDGFPDRDRLLRVAADLIGKASKAVNGKHRGVSACGECAPTLLGEWSVGAAIRVEQLWDEVARIYAVDILCGYSYDSFQCDENRQIFQRICGEHSTVHQDQGAS